MSGTIESRMADAVQEELSRFAAWCAKEWTMSLEMARREPELRDVTPGFIDGYNAAVGGIPVALEVYLEAQRP